MRASELIGAAVVDEAGQELGVVRDIRLAVTPTAAREPGSGLPIAGLVLARRGPISAAAHAWGYAEGRATGPAILRRLFAAEPDRARFVPVERVAELGPGRVRVRGEPGTLPSLREVLR